MKNFVAIVKLNDGVTSVIQLEAKDAVDAGVILKKFVFENYATPDKELGTMIYFEIGDKYEADLKRWYAEFEQIKAIAALENEKKKDLEEFERIKKKYNL